MSKNTKLDPVEALIVRALEVTSEHPVIQELVDAVRELQAKQFKWIDVADETPPAGKLFLGLTWFGNRKDDVVPRVLSFIPNESQGGVTLWARLPEVSTKANDTDAKSKTGA